MSTTDAQHDKQSSAAISLLHPGHEILVVDDTIESLQLLADILKEQGYRVRPTNSPSMALRSAHDNPPELILLDVRMPEMDGFELCQRLKQDTLTAAIPVIFISSMQEIHDRVRGFEVGGVDFISKPLQREEVLARVSTHLELELMRKKLSEMVEEKTHQLVLDEQRFETLYKLSTMNESDDGEPSAFALEAAVAMTRSDVGYLHFINEEQRHLDLFQCSEQIMEQCNATLDCPYPVDKTDIWADCIRTKKPVIQNDYRAMAGQQELSEGYFPLQRHMSVPIFDKGIAVAIIGVGNKQTPYNETDARQLSLFGSGVWALIRQKQADEQLRSALVQTIETVSHTVEQRDPYTAGHQRRVASLSSAIAQEMGLEADIIEGIYMGGVIHDIGKIHIPAEILNRPGKLLEHEFTIIKTHPQVGFDIIAKVDFPWPVADIVHQHHERLDGSGYPQGLQGQEICIEAQIMAVADVVEAMATHRPYRPALSIDTALQEIEHGSNSIYNSQAVTACLRLFREKDYQLNQTAAC